MPFSVALNQPQFEPGDDGLGQWDEIAAGIASVVGTAASVVSPLIASKAQTDAAKARAQIAMQQATTTAQIQSAMPITASPMFLPVVGGLAALLVIVMMQGRR
jgi:hypothetical protein